MISDKEVCMELRRHPKIKHWPPVWSGTYGLGNTFQHGENGVLEDVRLLAKDHIGPTRLQLEGKCEGRTFKGDLLSEDPKFLQQLHEKLKSSRGQPIRDIGSLEIEF